MKTLLSIVAFALTLHFGLAAEEKQFALPFANVAPRLQIVVPNGGFNSAKVCLVITNVGNQSGSFRLRLRTR